MKKDRQSQSNAVSGTPGFKSWLPIVISFISFGMSVFTLWDTKLAPFSLNVISTGRVTLTANPQSPGAQQSAIAIQLLFSNSGARPGYIDDVALIIRKLKGLDRPMVLRSLFEDTDPTLNFTKDLPPPKFSAFTSFCLRPGETVAKTIFFVPMKGTDRFVIEKGIYSVTPCTTVVGTDSEWVLWKSKDVDVDDDDMTALHRIVATPEAGGAQFVKLMLRSKTSRQQDYALDNLKKQVDQIK